MHDHTAASSDDVAVPIHILAVGEFRDETLSHSGQDERSLIAVSGLPADMTHD